MNQDVRAAKFFGQHDCNAVQHCLRQPVGRRVYRGIRAVRIGHLCQRTQRAGHIDDATVAVCLHYPDAGLGQQKRSDGIAFEGVLKNNGVELENAGVCINHDAGMFNQDVEAPITISVLFYAVVMVKFLLNLYPLPSFF